jgi:hypothetical protein
MKRTIQQREANKTNKGEAEKRGGSFKRAAARAAAVMGGAALIGFAGVSAGCGDEQENNQPQASAEKSTPSKAKRQTKAKSPSSKRSSRDEEKGITKVSVATGVALNSKSDVDAFADDLVLSSEPGSADLLIKAMRAAEEEYGQDWKGKTRWEVSASRIRAFQVFKRGYHLAVNEEVPDEPDISFFVSPRIRNDLSGGGDFRVDEGDFLQTEEIMKAGQTAPLVPLWVEWIRQDYGVMDMENVEFLKTYANKIVAANLHCEGTAPLGEVLKAMRSSRARSMFKIEDSDRFVSLLRKNALEDAGVDLQKNPLFSLRRENLENSLINSTFPEVEEAGIVTERTKAYVEYRIRQSFSHLNKHLDQGQQDFLAKNSDAREFILGFAPIPQNKMGECMSNPEDIENRTHDLVLSRLPRLVSILRQHASGQRPVYDLGSQEVRHNLKVAFTQRGFLKRRSNTALLKSGDSTSLRAEEYSDGYIVRDNQGRKRTHIKGIDAVYDEIEIPEKLRPVVTARLAPVLYSRIAKRNEDNKTIPSFDSDHSRQELKELGLEGEITNVGGVFKVDYKVLRTTKSLKKMIEKRVDEIRREQGEE